MELYKNKLQKKAMTQKVKAKLIQVKENLIILKIFRIKVGLKLKLEIHKIKFHQLSNLNKRSSYNFKITKINKNSIKK